MIDCLTQKIQEIFLVLRINLQNLKNVPHIEINLKKGFNII